MKKRNQLILGILFAGSLFGMACGTGENTPAIEHTADAAPTQAQTEIQSSTQAQTEVQTPSQEQTESQTPQEANNAEPETTVETASEPAETITDAIPIREYATPPDAILPDGLSNALDSMQFAYNGAIYTLTQTTYNEISAQLSVESFLERNHSSGYEIYWGSSSGFWYAENDAYDKNYHEEIRLHNFDTEAFSKKPYQECTLVVFKADCSRCTSSDFASVVVPGGITWGSTQEEIIAAYGEPGAISEYTDDTSIGYHFNMQTLDATYFVWFKVSPIAGVYAIELNVDFL